MYSFDVFGTLTSGTGEQDPAFYMFLQNQLQDAAYKHIPSFICKNFAQLRLNAKKMADRLFRINGRECVSLEQIYQVLSACVVADEKSALQEVKALECRELVRSAIGMDGNIRLVRRLLAEGKEVLFLADTVYSEQTVREILMKCSTDFADVPCYCSSTWGKLQKTGSLFWKVNHVTGIRRADWTHVSWFKENRIQAERVGIEVMQSRDMAAILAETEAACDYVTGQMQRLALAVIPECKNEKERIGCRIGAPILLAYVEWLLERAGQLGLDRLFFVARDGYILKKLADLLIRQRGLLLTTHYLYGSRRAWRTEPDCQNNSGAQNMSLPDRELLKRYLKQEIGTEGRMAAFVEWAGTGFTLECLSGVLKELGIPKTVNLYFKMDSKKSVQDSESCRNYLFWPHDMKDSAVTELLCRSSEGQTLGYQEMGGRIFPVLDEQEGQALQAFGYDAYISGVMLAAETYVRYLGDLLKREGSTAMVDFYMKKIESCPDPELLLFLCKMPYGITGKETALLECAPLLTQRQLEVYDSQGICPQDYKGSFFKYSLMRTQLECPQLADRYSCLKQGGTHTVQGRKYG